MKKQFRVEEFLNQFNISNTKQTQLKQIIITVLDEAIDDRLIKAQSQIYSYYILGYLGLEPRTIRLKAEYSTIELATLNNILS